MKTEKERADRRVGEHFVKSATEIAEKIGERTEAMKIMGAAQRRDTEIFIHGLKWCLGITRELARNWLGIDNIG